jgi:glutamyl-Q tRNA(Asp) synthetase
VRIEDVDRAREQPGAADAILRTLEAFGLVWDGPVARQSARGEHYAAALTALRARGLVYPCSCTRGELPPPVAGTTESRYPGTCRPRPRRPAPPHAFRLRTDLLPDPVTVVDRVQGPRCQDVAAEVGDFVLRRRDGYFAYQLAVVVDDAAQGVTDVVRGLDLWDNAPRQRLLQRALGLPEVRYLHLPLVVRPDGAKLSKSERAGAVDATDAPRLLGALLRALAVPLPDALHGAPVAEQLAFARGSFAPERLAGRLQVPVAEFAD